MSDRPHLHVVPDDAATPPHHPDYERWVIATAMTHPAIILPLQDRHGLTSTAFYAPHHETIWQALFSLHIRHLPVDPITIHDELARRGALTRHFLAATNGHPRTYLAELHGQAQLPDNATYYATRLVDLASRRRDLTLAQRAQQLALSDADDTHQAVLDLLVDHVQHEHAVTAARATTATGQDIDTFLADGHDDDHYEWVVPDFLERQDRLVLTAGEGHGKSTLLRQWGMQIAAGIHPFTEAPVEPARVLLLDLENSQRQTRRKLRPLRIAAGGRLEATNLIVECRPQGLDLTTTQDRAWLAQLLANHDPDLLITGPVYKLAGGDPTREEDSKPVALYLDQMRAEHDLAVILEAHTAKAASGAARRPREPYGWSGWLRWPELGLHLNDDGALTHWRGMRDERAIPSGLDRGGRWPWVPTHDVADDRWNQIKNLLKESTVKLSERQIADVTRMSRSTVQRILAEHTNEVAQLNQNYIPGGAS